MVRSAMFVMVVLFAALLATGCGGDGGGDGKDITDVRACLKKLDLKVEAPPQDDKDVEDGVFATTDLTKGEPTDLTVALAAVAKSDKAVERFQKESEDFSKTLSVGNGKAGELSVESDSDGRYVWVVAGAKDNDTFTDARGCVKP